ncbi:SPFH/Band 7/PHB domain protein, partial [Dietzia kunjamensis]|nr:SPFH/Band 7/PHB domain protein [Dietzia kunjamensis]
VKSVAKKDDDGVFRYAPADVDSDADLPSAPDAWFDTSTDPEIARSVAAAAAAAKSTTAVMDEQPSRPKPQPGVFDM